MNEQSKDSARRRDIAEERLNSAIMRLEFLIDSQKEAKVKVIKDLDEYTSKIEDILKG